jgi:hypothetical protein
MENLSLSALMEDGREICISPISRETFDASELEALGDDCGYFIYEVDGNRLSAGIEILAKVASYEAALRLVDIFLRGATLSPR